MEKIDKENRALWLWTLDIIVCFAAFAADQQIFCFCFCYLDSEGIDDVNIFLDLDNQDFVRLRLRTKTIKCIQRMQKEIRNAPEVEELVDDSMDELYTSAQSDEQTMEQTYNNQMENSDVLLSSDEDDTIDQSAPNPYKGIRLEKVSSCLW